MTSCVRYRLVILYVLDTMSPTNQTRFPVSFFKIDIPFVGYGVTVMTSVVPVSCVRRKGKSLCYARLDGREFTENHIDKGTYVTAASERMRG